MSTNVQVNNLTSINFFTDYYILNPISSELSDRDKVIASLFSAALLVFGGAIHLGVAIAWCVDKIVTWYKGDNNDQTNRAANIGQDVLPPKPEEPKTTPKPDPIVPKNPPIPNDPLKQTEIEPPQIQSIGEVKNNQLTLEQLKILAQPGQNGMVNGHDLLMDGAHLDKILSGKYDDNPDIIVSSVLDGDSIDLMFEKDAADNYQFNILLNSKPNAKYVLIPVLHATNGAVAKFHYTGIVLDFTNKEEKKLFAFNSLGRKTEADKMQWENQIIAKLETLSLVNKGQTFVNLKKHQNDGWSCAFRVLQFFEDSLEGKTIEEINNDQPVDNLLEKINNYLNLLVKEEQSSGMSQPSDFIEELEGLLKTNPNEALVNLRALIPAHCLAKNNLEIIEIFIFLSKHQDLLPSLMTKNPSDWLEDSVRIYLLDVFKSDFHAQKAIFDQFVGAYFEKTKTPFDPRSIQAPADSRNTTAAEGLYDNDTDEEFIPYNEEDDAAIDPPPENPGDVETKVFSDSDYAQLESD